MNRRHHKTTVYLALLGLSFSLSVQAQQNARPPGLKAKIRGDKDVQEIVLLGRSEEDKVIFAYASAPNVRSRIEPENLELLDVEYEYNRSAVLKALREQNWLSAALTLLPAIKPSLQFLDIPGNELTPLAFETAIYFMRAANTKAILADTDAARAGSKEYEFASDIFRQVGKAHWYLNAPEAEVLAVYCLTKLSKFETATTALEAIAIPGENEPAYGLYFLTQAEIRYANSEFREALRALSQSLMFETKNINSFPNALLLSGKCYEKIGNWHRARDVYFETARLFQNTYWAKHANDRLVVIMNQGLTAEEEAADVDKVFFDVNEDMNEAVRTHLNSLVEKQKEEKRHESE
ncbi:MAG: hypothetical protein K9N51_13095 [Candidatus Pacebacteria bacterium]|nr:hypothetical protein [Candidatus Paceibacterota bacterium]